LPAKIACFHCKKLFEDWKGYASHMLTSHKNDKERCEWATNSLATIEEKK
jgi:uncharacterized C2H2 Zn-finger protein